ncbi:MAG: Isoquinoline 1-oxidoreductase subunit [Proteobacteria bacterium]|nr:Isoquinoline 1-oxidoreductase subunit [Pseudomonadota bacterium]
MRFAQICLRQFAVISLSVVFGTALLFWQASNNLSHGEGTASAADSLKAWDKIATVLENPRCLNCHQVNSPLQGDERRLHVPLVVRGEDNLGVPGMRCTTCHSQTGNNPTSSVPGAPHWSLAPLEMNWQGLSPGDICRQLRDPKKNGNRNAEKLVTHFAEDELVGWGWTPGKGRMPVAMPRAELTEHVKTWLAGGSECPK